MSDQNAAATESQLDRFKNAAREALCDEDEARWEDKLRHVANHKPKDEKPAE